MLDKKIFARGVQLINSVLTKNSQINTRESLDSYYFLLADLLEEDFLLGVSNLMRNWTTTGFIPSPAEIREAVEKVMFNGLSKEEFLLIAQAFKHNPGLIKISDRKIINLINQVDLEKLDSNLIEFKDMGNEVTAPNGCFAVEADLSAKTGAKQAEADLSAKTGAKQAEADLSAETGAIISKQIHYTTIEKGVLL